MRNEKGFTLIELLAVIVILGILMFAAIPMVTRYINNSRKDTFVDNVKMALNQAKTEYAACNVDNDGCNFQAVSGETGCQHVSIASLDFEKELKSPFPNGGNITGDIKVCSTTATGGKTTNTWTLYATDSASPAHGFGSSTEYVGEDSVSRGNVS